MIWRWILIAPAVNLYGERYLFNDIVKEDYLCQLHSEVVFIGARLEVADNRRSDTKRRHKETGDDKVCGFPCFGVHQQQRDVLFRNPPEQVQHHQRIQVFLKRELEMSSKNTSIFLKNK